MAYFFSEQGIYPCLSQLIDFTETSGLYAMNQLLKKCFAMLKGELDRARRLKNTEGVYAEREVGGKRVLESTVSPLSNAIPL